MNFAVGNLPIHYILSKLSLKGKTVPKFDGGVKCFKKFSNKWNIYMNLEKTAKYITYQMILHKTIFILCDLYRSFTVLGYASHVP